MTDDDRLSLFVRPGNTERDLGFLTRFYNRLKTSFDEALSGTDELIKESKEQNARVDKLLEEGKDIREMFPDL